MDRKRLGRALSLLLSGLGGILCALSIVSGQTPGVVFGILSFLIGVVLYRKADRLFETPTGSVTFDPTDTRVLLATLLQLGLALLVFASLTHVFSDIVLIESLQTGLQAPTFLLSLGAILGVTLGGGVVVLTYRWSRLHNASRSLLVPLIGFSITFGTYLLLLSPHPQAALVYAAVYTLSRLLALFGVRWWMA